jgi:hypothetical protein
LLTAESEGTIHDIYSEDHEHCHGAIKEAVSVRGTQGCPEFFQKRRPASDGAKKEVIKPYHFAGKLHQS